MAVDEATLERLEPEAAPHVPHNKLVIIAWSGDLDKVWPQLILATTGVMSSIVKVLSPISSKCPSSLRRRIATVQASLSMRLIR